MNFIMSIVNWILSLFNGGGSNGPVRIGDHCYMPLFYRNLSSKVDATWNYLSKSDGEKQHLRKHIKDNAKSGETPAIVFCLTPQNINGGLLNNSMAAPTAGMLDYLEAKCRELVEDGIAVFLCLYVDDSIPRWWEIEKHKAIWTQIHARVCKYVTGCVLSIEANEYANNVGQLAGCITAMRAAMPKADYYGLHLQWLASNGKYSWRGISSVPASAGLVLAEYTHDPNKGNLINEATFRSQCRAIEAANPAVKIVHQEFNVDVLGAQGRRQTEILREEGVWGVAAVKGDEVEV